MKSVVLSLLLTTALLLFVFTVSDKKSSGFYNRFPAWTAVILLLAFCAGYVVAIYWGVTGITKGQRLLNAGGICFSIFGLAVFYYGYKMQSGSGKESPGQFSYSLDAIEPVQKAALDRLLRQSGMNDNEVRMVNYWSMNQNEASFSVCIQGKNIIALQIKGKPLADLSPLSDLKNINWVVLQNCGIKTLRDIHLPALERLYVNDNKLAALDGLDNFPKLGWVKIDGNPLTDSSALKNHSGKSLYIVD